MITDEDYYTQGNNDAVFHRKKKQVLLDNKQYQQGYEDGEKFISAIESGMEKNKDWL